MHQSQQIVKKVVMKNTKRQNRKNSSVIDRLFTRHESWKNHRRHTGLKLIRFA